MSSTRLPSASCGRIPLLLSVHLFSARVKPFPRQKAWYPLLLPAPLTSVTPECLRVALAYRCPIDATPTQQGPHDPGIFVRHRHGCPVPPATREQPPSPLAALVRLQPHPAQRCPCTVDQQLPHIAIASLTDPSQEA